MSQKILIIEDEPDIRKTLEYNISREGYEVISASSLSEGREKLESASFSLLLLDLMLPDGSGLDLCRELKQDKSLSSMPVIILTAKDDEVDKVVGFELGADDYVTKPFSVRELILRVKAVLKRGERKSDNMEVQRQFGELKIDVDSHEVFVNDEQVSFCLLYTSPSPRDA